MNYSKRQLYALGEPLGNSVTENKVGGGRIYGGGGGGGPIGDLVSAVTDPISSALGTDGSGGGALGALASIDPGPAIGDAGVAIDQGVNSAVPGGWATVGALAAAAVTGGAALGAMGALEAGTVASADAVAAGMGFSSAAEAISAGAITAEGLGLPAATTVAELGAVEGTASAGWAGLGVEPGVAGGVSTGAAGSTGDVFGGYSATGSSAGTAGGTVPAGYGTAADAQAAAAAGGGTYSPAGTYGPGSAAVTDYSVPASAATQSGADAAAAAQAGYTPAQVAQAAAKGISVAKLLQGAGAALGIIPAAANLFGGGLKGTGATSATDPYAQYRPQAAQQLNQLMNQPSAALSQPGYQQTLTEGLKQAQRGAAATGQLQSGAEMAALQSQGQNVFGSYYNTLLGNLMQMSGASQSPASGAVAAQQIAASKQNVQNQQLGTITSGLGSIASLYGSSAAQVPATQGSSGIVGGYQQLASGNATDYGQTDLSGTNTYFYQ